MRHRKNDAAPLFQNGAHASNQNIHPKSNSVRRRCPASARHNAPPGTSDVAAARIAGHAAKQRADVLAVIVKAGGFGATDAEIELAAGIRAQSVSPRRGELRALCLIVDSGRRRPTPRGRPAAVWVLPEFAPKPATIAPVTPGGAPGPEGGAA